MAALITGDSNTYHGEMTQSLQKYVNDAAGANPPVSSMVLSQLGTQHCEQTDLPAVLSEGHPGWTVSSFYQDSDTAENPFWNPNLPGYDMSYYLSQHGYSLGSGDVLPWILGTNSFNDAYFTGHGTDSLIYREEVMLREMIRRQQLACATKVLLFTTIPIALHAPNPQWEHLPQLYAPMLMRVAASYSNVEVLTYGPVLDRISGFDCATEASGSYASTTVPLPAPTCEVHFNRAGDQMLAVVFLAWIKWQVRP